MGPVHCSICWRGILRRSEGFLIIFGILHLCFLCFSAASSFGRVLCNKGNSNSINCSGLYGMIVLLANSWRFVSSSFHFPDDMVGYALYPSHSKPAWLEALLTDKFFVACSNHLELRKNESNIFCIDCSKSICQHCLPNHRSHRLLQVRRYVYHDVIRLLDLQKLLDCSLVQTYIINSAKVVFLNQRPQSRPAKGLVNSCQTCDRSLQEAYCYCSVSCKVNAVLNKEKDLSTLLYHCSSLPFPDIFYYSPREISSKDGKLAEIGEELSASSMLEETCSGSNANDVRWMLTCSEIDMPLVKKICRRVAAPHSIARPSTSRRKGVPHRSPIY